MVVCRVALLDGTTFEPKGIDKNSTGQLVFDKVAKHLDVIETDYFGLTFRDKTGKKFWLDNTKKITKQVKGGTWVFEFQVKFYPPDPMALKEDVTRYQLSLQVRVDLFNGRLPCSFATYALLGSYTVQAELGDWEQKEFGDTVQYLHDFDFAPGQNAELLEKITELHKNHRGQTPTVAEAHFLENAKKLAMYGVDMHDVKDSENKRLTLGICATGILVYKDRLRISRFVWPKILKLSYKRDSFYIKIRPGEFEPHERTISFRCDTHKLAKRLWKTCVEHHAFFRLKTADPPSSDTLFPRFNTRFRYSGRTAVQARKAAEMTDREEPHIARTAERRSMHDKNRSLDASALKNKPYDENDLYDKKHGDPDATLERDRNADDLYSKVQKRPNGEDASDRLDHRPGDEPGTEGPPAYSADTSALSDGGKKSKKDKEEEKKRKKEEERRRKEEEKERKRLEKLEKDKKKGKAQETSIDDAQPDPATLEQLKEDYMQLLRETPDITSTSRYEDIEPKISHDRRYQAVDKAARKQWFDEYVENMLKADFMRLLRETPTIHSQSTWPEARQDIEFDPRFQAVGSEAQREEWFNEYILGLLKSDYIQLLKETPSVHSHSRWEGVKSDLENDPRYLAVPTDSQREAWFDEYIQNLKKEEFMRLLNDTPDITSYSRYDDVKDELSRDPRFQNVDTEAQRKQYFNEYVQDLLKEHFMQLLRETPDITSTSHLEDVEHKIDHDPRYKAVDKDSRKRWFKEYVDDLLKSDFMRLLRDTPTIDSKSRWPEARQEIDLDPRFQAVGSEPRREFWFNEYVQGLIKSEFMQMLRESPSVDSQSRWEGVKSDLEYDERYWAVPTDSQRKDYFNEFIQNLKKEEFKDLLNETPGITSYSRYEDVKAELSHDPRYQNVDTDAEREQYFNEYIQDLKKASYVQLLQDTPDITSYSEWHQSKHHIDQDPRYHGVDTDLQRAKWFNEYVNILAGRGYGAADFGLKIGGFKSIDRRQEFIPVEPSTTATKSKPMPFFEPVGETDVDSLGRKKKPPPVAKKPRGSGAFDTEDSLFNSQTGVPVTVRTESYKYTPDMNDVPRSTSNIPIVETKTHKVTYEKDGIPYETEDSILISAHSVTTKSQTIDTTTYKTERDGVIETRVERKITVTSDENDDLDHDAMLRAAIEEVTRMNPDISVEKIECMRQIEEVNGN